MTPLKQVGAALLSGIGGGNIITRIRQQINQRQTITALSETMDQASKFVEAMTEATEEGGEKHETADEEGEYQESETGNHN